MYSSEDTVCINVKISVELHREMKIAAITRRVTIQELVSEAIRKEVEENG